MRRADRVQFYVCSASCGLLQHGYIRFCLRVDPDEAMQVMARLLQHIHFLFCNRSADGMTGDDRTRPLTRLDGCPEVSNLEWRWAIIAHCQLDEARSNRSAFDAFGQLLCPEIGHFVFAHLTKRSGNESISI